MFVITAPVRQVQTFKPPPSHSATRPETGQLRLHFFTKKIEMLFQFELKSSINLNFPNRPETGQLGLHFFTKNILFYSNLN